MDADDLLTRLGGFFAARGDDEVWLVGGAVRDAIRGREFHDIDLAVSRESAPIGRALADLLGGTAIPMEPWDLTRVALPGDSAGGPPFVVDIKSYTGSLEHDLLSRDFTVDAMAVPLRSWDTDQRFDGLLDPTGGIGDLSRKVLRATGDAVFQSDPGRMIRGVRLAGQLGFRMEPDTAGAIRRDAHLLDRVSAERVRDEFMAILADDGARVQLEVLDRLDLLCRVIPELDEARGCEQPPAHHYWDVWGHLLHCVEYAEAVTAGHRNNAIYTMAPWTAAEEAHFAEMIGDGHNRRTVLKLAALLHDIAKPQTKAPDKNGRIRFLGHSELGAEMVTSRLSALRMSHRTTALVSTMVRHHLRPSQIRDGDSMPSPRAIYRYYRDLGDAAVDTLYLGMADVLAARGPELLPERWNNYARMIATVLEAGAAPPKREEGARALVNGHDLMDTLNMSPGPRVGALLERLREAEAVGEITTREEALSLAGRLLAGGSLEGA